jgi:hypothetical protein
VRALLRAQNERNSGCKVVPALRPPQIVRLPWNSYTFSATYSTATATTITITIGNIRQQIISRMGLAGATGSISLKVQSCAAWNTSVGPGFGQPSLEGLFWELNTDSGGSYSVRSEQYDHGTLNIPARVGYIYPLTDRKEVHTSANDSHVVARFVVPAGGDTGNVTVRTHILWNSAAVPAVKNVHSLPNPEEVLAQEAALISL